MSGNKKTLPDLQGYISAIPTPRHKKSRMVKPPGFFIWHSTVGVNEGKQPCGDFIHDEIRYGFPAFGLPGLPIQGFELVAMDGSLRGGSCTRQGH
jgi:hypothetical protein